MDKFLKVYLVYSRGILIDVMESMEAAEFLASKLEWSPVQWYAIEVPVTMMEDIIPRNNLN